MAAAAAAAELPEAPNTLLVVSLVDLRADLRRYRNRFTHFHEAGVLGARVGNALENHGALLLQLPPDEAEALKAALAASDALFAPRSDGAAATPLVGGKALVEYRSGADAPTVPAGVALSAERAHACLVSAGRDILRALNSFGALLGKSHALEGHVVVHEVLLEPPSAPRRRDRRRRADAAAAAAAAVEPSGSPSVLTFLHYDAGAQAAPHTDRGLLTLVFAEQAGLEVRMRGSETWTAPALSPNSVLVFAGECLQVATGNVVRACVHRVAPGAAPRRSLVMRMRAHPEAGLPLVFGQYWRCATVREFNARFAATHSSVNEPLRVLPLAPAAASVVRRGVSTRSVAISLVEIVLALPELAAAIAHALGDDVKALASAELVCRALRDAVAPHWRRICLACRADPRPEHLARFAKLGTPELPSCIVATDARQWCALLFHLAVLGGSITIKIKDQDFSEVHFKVKRATTFGKIFDAYCTKKHLPRDHVRFQFDGNRIFDVQTPQEMEMEDGDSVDAMMEQVGD